MDGEINDQYVKILLVYFNRLKFILSINTSYLNSKTLVKRSYLFHVNDVLTEAIVEP